MATCVNHASRLLSLLFIVVIVASRCCFSLLLCFIVVNSRRRTFVACLNLALDAKCERELEPHATKLIFISCVDVP